MVDQIINYDEEMVGANHPSKTDTLNRALEIEHNSDGTHKTAAYLAGATFNVEHVVATGVHDPDKVLPTPTFLVEHNADGTHKWKVAIMKEVVLANEATEMISEGANGWAFCAIGDNEEYANIRFSNIGAINIIINTPHIINSDTDGNLCIYNIGSSIIIKNRLGDTKTLIYEVHTA
jgi:hypothetical protein